MNFSEQIIEWYAKNKRILPWRNSSDSYKIWLSEIILQQTRVEQGLPYFKEFITKEGNISLDDKSITERNYQTRGMKIFKSEKINVDIN